MIRDAANDNAQAATTGFNNAQMASRQREQLAAHIASQKAGFDHDDARDAVRFGRDDAHRAEDRGWHVADTEDARGHQKEMWGLQEERADKRVNRSDTRADVRFKRSEANQIRREEQRQTGDEFKALQAQLRSLDAEAAQVESNYRTASMVAGQTSDTAAGQAALIARGQELGRIRRQKELLVQSLAQMGGNKLLTGGGTPPPAGPATAAPGPGAGKPGLF
jgi:hypothetical protein